MINLNAYGSNNFIIWTNGDILTGEYYLIGLKNGFTNIWSYVLANKISSNSRFIELSIDIVKNSLVDELNGKIFLGPNGNWDYKIWNIVNATLDPSNGILIDKGQVQLENSNPIENENIFETYISDNEDFKSIVYLTSASCPVWGYTGRIWNKWHYQFGSCRN